MRRYPHFLALLILMGGALLLSFSQLAAQQRDMTILDLIAIPSVSSPQVSPDGTRIVYVKSEADWEENRTISHLFMVNADGTGTIQLTYGKEGQSSPAWSPDGRWIAFTARREEQEATQVHLLPVGGGEAKPLTNHETSVSSVSWSPDGASLYFLASDPETEEDKKKEELGDDVYAFDEDYKQVHLWKVDVATGEESHVTEGDFSLGQYSVSSDGTRIAHMRAPSPLYGDVQWAEVWLMNADGTEPIQLTSDTVPQAQPQLSPNGDWVLFTADANEEFDFYYNDKIFLIPAAGGEARVLLPDFGGAIDQAAWSADGNSIYFRANIGIREELFRVDLESRDLTRLTEGDHAVGGTSYDPTNGLAAFTIQNSRSPGDVWIMDLHAGSPPRQVTHIHDHLPQTFRLPRQEAIRWRGEDGVDVEGLLFWPLNYQEGQRYPLIVQTHGGPASSDKFQFGGSSDYIQILTAKGYFVLLPNYRGSTGYGDAFLRDMVGHYFNQAHKDVMAGVDYLIDRGLVDGDRMGKMGWSAGGHMTNKIITYTDRFKAASSGAGASNWISMYAQSDVRVYRTPWFGGNPWEEDAPIEQYWEDSPLKQVSGVTTPTLFLVGEQDYRVPMPQSVEMYRALKALGVPTHLYVAPRQPHGWRELYHRLYKANVEMDWWERWIMDREYVWEEPPEMGG
ncbi:MAG: S9 family peptidase [Gemmatimonadota bacterium]|jgi:dipeptidyl aminopeptidase/acylaminoacyl peptidase